MRQAQREDIYGDVANDEDMFVSHSQIQSKFPRENISKPEGGRGPAQLWLTEETLAASQGGEFGGI